jgi:hypothetical protein
MYSRKQNNGIGTLNNSKAIWKEIAESRQVIARVDDLLGRNNVL